MHFTINLAFQLHASDAIKKISHIIAVGNVKMEATFVYANINHTELFSGHC